MNEIVNISGADFIRLGIRVIVIIIAGFATLKIVNSSIGISFKKIAKKSALSSYKSRLNTLEGLIKNVVGFVIFIILVLLIASDLGFNITPILTGAGILGLAVSFGSQSMVKDLISGFFLILDNQINVGDKVRIGTIEGKVVKIMMRNIVLKDKDGNLIYIPNAEIKTLVVYKKEAKLSQE